MLYSIIFRRLMKTLKSRYTLDIAVEKRRCRETKCSELNLKHTVRRFEQILPTAPLNVSHKNYQKKNYFTKKSEGVYKKKDYSRKEYSRTKMFSRIKATMFNNLEMFYIDLF